MKIPPQHLDTPSKFEDYAWAHIADSSSPFRNLALGTVDASGHPQSRFVVLRAADQATRIVEFHTDIRSPKWTEIGVNPVVTLLGYEPGAYLQIRLKGHAVAFGPQTPEQAAVWNSLNHWTRTTYCGGPPGHTIKEPDATIINHPTEADTAHGSAWFGVIRVTITAMDIYQHPRGDVRRAEISYDGKDVNAQWITP